MFLDGGTAHWDVKTPGSFPSGSDINLAMAGIKIHPRGGHTRYKIFMWDGLSLWCNIIRDIRDITFREISVAIALTGGLV